MNRSSATRRVACTAMLAVAGVTLAATLPAAQASAAPRPTPGRSAPGSSAPRLVGTSASVDTDSTGVARAIRTSAGHPLPQPAVAVGRSRADVAGAYVQAYGRTLGIAGVGGGSAGAVTVTAPRVLSGGGGSSTVHYALRAGRWPVFAGGLVVALDADGQMTGMTGHGLSGSVRNGPVGAAAAIRTATSLVARQTVTPPAALRATSPAKVVYDPALVGDPQGGRPGTAWQLTVSHGSAVRRLVLVDSTSGAVRLDADELERDSVNPNRVVCDLAEKKVQTPGVTVEPTIARGGYGCSSAAVRTTGRIEDGPASSLTDVNDAYTYARDTATFYSQVVGVNLTDLIGTTDQQIGAGNGTIKELRSTTRTCFSGAPCPYPNAFWDGNQMVYGSGFASAVDVVGHEMTHGVTQHTSALAYVFQPGAINESMSDVLGELVQQYTDPGQDRSWLLGEDLPGGAIRSASDPEAYGQPDAMTSSTYAALTDPVDYYGWDNGGVHTNSGVGNQAAYLMTEGGTLNGVTVAALDTMPRTAHPTSMAPGLKKVAEIYYETEQLMTPATNYVDLAADLQQACTNLTTRTGLAVPVKAADCRSVTSAVAATKMTAQPPQKSVQLTRAPYCTGTDVPSTPILADGFDTTADQQKLTFSNQAVLTFDPFAYSPGFGILGAHTLTPGTPGPYATTSATVGGVRIADSLYGQTPDTGAALTSYATSGTIRLPARTSAAHLFLRFARADELEAYPTKSEATMYGKPAAGYYDGGRVQLRTVGGSWVDLRASFVSTDGAAGSGYDHTISDGSTAFAGYGGGWETSRANITAYAGQQVQVRFLTIGDVGVASNWFVDDLYVYACNPAATVSAVGNLAAQQVDALADDGTANANLSWTTPTLPPGASVTGYTVTVTQGGVSSSFVLGDGTQTRTTLSGLTPTQDATFTVTPLSSTGAGPASSVTLGGTRLAAITMGRPVVSSSGTIQLTGQLSTPSGAALVGVPLALVYCADAASTDSCAAASEYATKVSFASGVSGRFVVAYRQRSGSVGSGYWRVTYAGESGRRFAGQSPARHISVSTS